MTAKKPEKHKKRWRGIPSPDGVSRKHKETVRRCIVTRETLPMESMIRFCVAPDGTLTPDLAHKLPGRGIWVKADRSVVAQACEKNLFAKPARRKVKYPENTDGLITTLFVKRLQSLLGVAKKAGLVVAGFEKVAESLRKGQVFCLIEATDAAQDGLEKLCRLCAEKNVPVVRILAADQAAEALGAELCVHTALKSGGVSDLFLAEARRFTAYCQTELC